MRNLNDYITNYKIQMEKGDVQIAYEKLVKYVMSLKQYYKKEFSNIYSFGNISQGYMDFTYFPFFDTFLRSKKLRFGIVLNHKKIRFELWLMGQNSKIQLEYWDLLKTTKWNKDQKIMPKYTVLEAVLVENPNFNDLDALTSEIGNKSISVSDEVLEYLKSIS